jgi:Photosynthesis system II assembly factor YCF48
MNRYLIALGFATLIGCSSSSPSSTAGGGSGGNATVCVAGQQVSCACVGGLHGAQACNADGSGYLTCVCPMGVAGASGGGGGGASGGGAVTPDLGDAGSSGEAGESSMSAGGGGTDSGGGGPTAFRAITILPDAENDSERVTGFFCSSPKACVISTDPFGDAGHIYASDGQAITGTPVSGDKAEATLLGTIGTVSFLGFSQIGAQLIAHVSGAEGGLVTATGDVTKAASWKSGLIAADVGAFGLNTQFGISRNAGHTTMMTKGRIWDTTATPGATAAWTNIYSPQAAPPIPADIADQRTADPTLCDTDPSVSFSPDLTQSLYVAADLSLVVTPSGAVNQFGDDPAGVCISTDGGHSFHNAAFIGVDIGAGPLGVTCTSKDHCVAYGGIDSTAGSTYIYVSTDASKGARSHWAAATTPTLSDGTEFRSAAFAPDGMHGWIVGATGAPKALLFTTTDGGATWTDASPTIAALAQGNRLHSVYAFDENHVWIGGENGILLTSGD